MWEIAALSLYAWETISSPLRDHHLQKQELELVLQVQVLQYLRAVLIQSGGKYMHCRYQRMYFEMIQEIQFNCIPSN